MTPKQKQFPVRWSNIFVTEEINDQVQAIADKYYETRRQQAIRELLRRILKLIEDGEIQFP